MRALLVSHPLTDTDNYCKPQPNVMGSLVTHTSPKLILFRGFLTRYRLPSCDDPASDRSSYAFVYVKCRAPLSEQVARAKVWVDDSPAFSTQVADT